MSPILRGIVSLLVALAILAATLTAARGLFAAWSFFGVLVILSAGIYALLPRPRGRSRPGK